MMFSNHAILEMEAEDYRDFDKGLRQTLWGSVTHIYHVLCYVPRTDHGRYIQQGA